MADPYSAEAYHAVIGSLLHTSTVWEAEVRASPSLEEAKAALAASQQCVANAGRFAIAAAILTLVEKMPHPGPYPIVGADFGTSPGIVPSPIIKPAGPHRRGTGDVP